MPIQRHPVYEVPCNVPSTIPLNRYFSNLVCDTLVFHFLLQQLYIASMALVGYRSISFSLLLVIKHLGVRFGVYSLACKRRSLLILGLFSLERF